MLNNKQHLSFNKIEDLFPCNFKTGRWVSHAGLCFTININETLHSIRSVNIPSAAFGILDIKV
jgi:hypothetical protein